MSDDYRDLCEHIREIEIERQVAYWKDVMSRDYDNPAVVIRDISLAGYETSFELARDPVADEEVARLRAPIKWDGRYWRRGACMTVEDVALELGVTTQFLQGFKYAVRQVGRAISEKQRRNIRFVNPFVNPSEPAGDCREVEYQPEVGRVYFIEEVGAERIKIGYSKNPASRLNSLATATASDLLLLKDIAGTVDDEKSLHERFSHLRIRREWFRKTAELMDAIASF